MARHPRIEFPGAIYHVTSRGDRGESVFADDVDRRKLLSVMAAALSRFQAYVLAYCLMGNHYHLVIRTDQANLSRVMHYLNGVFTQAFNDRHSLFGHLFQGRYHAVLVDRDAYLLEACRYVELNPVRAGLCGRPDAWEWSSYRFHVGLLFGPPWLDTGEVLACMLGRPPRDAADLSRAQALYAELVHGGRDVRLWDLELPDRRYLGDAAFAARMQLKAEPLGRPSSRPASLAAPSKSDILAHWLQTGRPRDEAVAAANRHGGMTMSALADHLGVSVSTISRMIRSAESRLTTQTAQPEQER